MWTSYLLYFLIMYVGTKRGYFLLPTLFPFVHAPTMVYSHTHKSQSVQIDNEEKFLLPFL